MHTNRQSAQVHDSLVARLGKNLGSVHKDSSTACASPRQVHKDRPLNPRPCPAAWLSSAPLNQCTGCWLAVAGWQPVVHHDIVEHMLHTACLQHLLHDLVLHE